MNYLTLLSLSLCLCFACSTPSGTQKDPSPATTKPTLLLQYAKGPCFGECPMFKMEVYTKGGLVYRGIRYTEKAGLHRKQLSDARLKNLKTTAKKAKLWDKPASYLSGLADSQKTTLSYHEGGKQKEIKLDGNKLPSELQELLDALEVIANSSGWANADASKEDPLNPTFIQDEIIVQLKKGADVKVWLTAFKNYELSVKDKIAPSMNMWLLQFDKQTIAPRKMLERIKLSDSVINAEFNKNLDQRN
ncbi:MAG: DUF6438 domain-containing protein [Saprospiraceae bacterium]